MNMQIKFTLNIYIYINISIKCALKYSVPSKNDS